LEDSADDLSSAYDDLKSNIQVSVVGAGAKKARGFV
jgi:hypothetical protein